MASMKYTNWAKLTAKKYLFPVCIMHYKGPLRYLKMDSPSCEENCLVSIDDSVVSGQNLFCLIVSALTIQQKGSLVMHYTRRK